MPHPMPDIANTSASSVHHTLDWVGMSAIEIPLKIATKGMAATVINAKAQAFVNLIDTHAKGIHMSRLFLALDQLSNEPNVTPAQLKTTLDAFISSHDDISDRARLSLSFELPLRRSALLSDNSGWKFYPIILDMQLNQGQLRVEAGVEVTYSSTCPCSAALARQLIQENFKRDFDAENLNFEQVLKWLGTTEGISATPHSQRSVAQTKVLLDAQLGEFDFVAIIDEIEQTLKTPVQTAVKREDEQEFARLNGANLMFCEDAARKVKAALDERADVLDFWVRINHYESLHAHDAVAITTKGLPQGYQP
ncbi:GTP cyclohydrolase FolE2 [Pseudoalteromonas sp. THAF3]|uniref:GTP cyclohydrolase FolE2 n=1 Tax=Pseudoalteromonas sp. THAF3 TaxID=2587843 RepID=UPI00126830AF|nr:GTP cyclohydrolase FolE2 [Pseudoalteromonas sp. THAF3]QFU05629.1 GTP cyclohydrolase FolE2 [Pseudoalteromonas sp. THAF3]